jgi:hypothetical protein
MVIILIPGQTQGLSLQYEIGFKKDISNIFFKFSDSEQIFQNSLSQMAKLQRKSLNDLSALLCRAEVREIH